MLQELLKELATKNAELEMAKIDVDVKEQILRRFSEYQALEVAKEKVKQLKDKIEDRRGHIKADAKIEYNTTGEKKPAPGVVIKVGKRLVYREIDAFDYCQESLPAALKLDKWTFEKYAKCVYEVQPLDFVAIEGVLQVTIAKDLSGYLN